MFKKEKEKSLTDESTDIGNEIGKYMYARHTINSVKKRGKGPEGFLHSIK